MSDTQCEKRTWCQCQHPEVICNDDDKRGSGDCLHKQFQTQYDKGEQYGNRNGFRDGIESAADAIEKLACDGDKHSGYDERGPDERVTDNTIMLLSRVVRNLE